MLGFLVLSFSHLYNKAGANREASFFIVRVFYWMESRRWITSEDVPRPGYAQEPPFSKPILRLDGHWSLKYCPLLRLLPILFSLTFTKSTKFFFYSGLTRGFVIIVQVFYFEFRIQLIFPLWFTIKNISQLTLFFLYHLLKFNQNGRINMNMIALKWVFKSENGCCNISRGNSRRNPHYMNN